MDDNQIKKIKGLLSKEKTIVIIPHKNPDGDAIGSSTALDSYLKKLGHKSLIVCPNHFPKFLNWMDPKKKIKIFEDENELKHKILNCDIIFNLDFNNLSRISSMKDCVEASQAIKIMIDHHENPKNYCDFMYSDPKMSSTCEMVYRFISMLGDESLIDYSISESLYAGIMTDTGSFRFPATTHETHNVVSKLLKNGISHSEIHNHIYDNNRLSKIKLLSHCLQKIEILKNFKTCFLFLTRDELEMFDYEKGDTEGIVNYGLSIENIKFAVIFKENINDNSVRISLRSKGNFDVNKFAKDIFNGGGHKNAAGAISKLNMKQTINLFKNSLVKYKNQLN